MAIKGIFFDAAGIFYKRAESTRIFVRRLLREHNHSDKLSAKDRVRQQALHDQANRGHIHPETYWDEVLQMYGVAALEERAGLIKKILTYVCDVHAMPGGRETTAALKQRGFLLGIVTDTIYPLEWKMDWLAKTGVAEFIDIISCSSVLGVHKPDPAIYLDAVRQARLTVVESAFVGHDADELEGAGRVDLVTVAVNYDPHAQADYYAETLLDLLNVPVFQVASL